MNCEEAQELLSAYVDGQLEERDRACVQAHLQDCPSCAEEQEGFSRVNELLDSWDLVEPPAGLAERVVALTDLAHLVQAPQRRPVLDLVKGAGLAFAAAVVAVVALWLLHGHCGAMAVAAGEEATALAQEFTSGLGDAAFLVIHRIWTVTAIAIAYAMLEVGLSIRSRVALKGARSR